MANIFFILAGISVVLGCIFGFLDRHDHGLLKKSALLWTVTVTFFLSWGTAFHKDISFNWIAWIFLAVISIVWIGLWSGTLKEIREASDSSAMDKTDKTPPTKETYMPSSTKSIVSSMSHGGTEYEVDHERRTCSCPDFQQRRFRYITTDPRRLCKHLISALDPEELKAEVTDEQWATLVLCRKNGKGYPFSAQTPQTTARSLQAKRTSPSLPKAERPSPTPSFTKTNAADLSISMLPKGEQEFLERLSLETYLENDRDYDRFENMLEKYETTQNPIKYAALLDYCFDCFTPELLKYLQLEEFHAEPVAENLIDYDLGLFLDIYENGSCLGEVLRDSLDTRDILKQVVDHIEVTMGETEDPEVTKLRKKYEDYDLFQKAWGQFQEDCADAIQELIVTKEEKERLDKVCKKALSIVLGFLKEGLPDDIGITFYKTKSYTVIHPSASKRNWICRLHLERYPQIELRNEDKKDIETLEALEAMKNAIVQKAKEVLGLLEPEVDPDQEEDEGPRMGM